MAAEAGNGRIHPNGREVTVRRYCGILLALLLLALPVMATDVVAMDWDGADAVWAAWAQDAGPPVVVVDNAQLFTSYQQEPTIETHQPAAVRTDNLGTRSTNAESTTGAHKLTASLSDGTRSGRMVTAWRAGEPRAG